VTKVTVGFLSSHLSEINLLDLEVEGSWCNLISNWTLSLEMFKSYLLIIFNERKGVGNGD
jgi:hypothetical protein